MTATIEITERAQACARGLILAGAAKAVQRVSGATYAAPCRVKFRDAS
jgi:hypothetical protein